MSKGNVNPKSDNKMSNKDEFSNSNFSADFHKANFKDPGRPSSVLFQLNCSDFGKESLGILPDISYRDSIFSTTFRESLGILNITLMDCGKDSLLTLPSKENDMNSGSIELPAITLTKMNDMESLNLLNTGFCDENLSKTKNSSNSITNLNSMSLEGPSKIYSLSRKSTESKLSDDMERRLSNDFFENLKCSQGSTISSINSPLNKARLISVTELNDVRLRIHSLPVHIEEELQTEQVKGFKNTNLSNQCWSVDKITKTKSLRTRSFSSVLDFEENNEKDFNDSVFVEGNRLADKFANNSIYEEDNDDISSITLDFPDEPEKEENAEKLKTIPGTIFKTVDKLLIPSQNMKIKIKSSHSESVSSNEPSSLPENASTSSKRQESRNLSKTSQNSEKDPLTLLKNLSEVLQETDILSKSQKSESQNMINNLASLLSEPRGSNDFEDSGHSSIEEIIECPVKSKLAQKTPTRHELLSECKSENNISMDNEKKPVIKIHMTTPNSSSRNKKSSNNFSRKSVTCNKTNQNEVKRGPLKAVIPVESMSKLHSNILVQKDQKELAAPKERNSKRTSTPIHEPRLRPMAASTPASLTSKMSKLEVSPLARPKISSYDVTKSKGYSPKFINKSLSSISKSEKKLVRSNSMGVCANLHSDEKDCKLRRSNSVGKDTSLMTALSKARQNILNSPYYQQSALEENRKRISLPRPSNLSLKMKNPGKENKELKK